MTCHYPNQGSVPHWLCQEICVNQSEAPPRSGYWHVISMEFFALIPLTPFRGETSGGLAIFAEFLHIITTFSRSKFHTQHFRFMGLDLRNFIKEHQVVNPVKKKLQRKKLAHKSNNSYFVSPLIFLYAPYLQK